MGFSITSSSSSPETTAAHHHTLKVFLLCNYILLGTASSCIFLILSLRLLPSLYGLSVILLHAFTIIGAVSACAAASASSSRSSTWYATHMVTTVLTAIFQGAVAVLVFTRTSEFLTGIKSYVREEDGEVILRMAGGLSIAIFCLEWVAMGLAFALRYYAFVDGECLGGGGGGGRRSAKVQQEEDVKDWPWPGPFHA